jgi:hypothetical protein
MSAPDVKPSTWDLYTARGSLRPRRPARAELSCYTQPPAFFVNERESTSVCLPHVGASHDAPWTDGPPPVGRGISSCAGKSRSAVVLKRRRARAAGCHRARRSAAAGAGSDGRRIHRVGERRAAADSYFHRGGHPRARTCAGARMGKGCTSRRRDQSDRE